MTAIIYGRERQIVWRVLACAAFAMALSVLAAVPAAAINDKADGGQDYEQPAADITYWVSTSQPPPGDEINQARWENSADWAADQYSYFAYGTAGLDIWEGSSDAAANMDVRWINLGPGVYSMAVQPVWTGGEYRCGLSSQDCVLTVNTYVQWHVLSTAAPLGVADAREVFLHEFGHAMGLGHSAASNRSFTSVVMQYATTRSLSKDDCASLVFQTQDIATCNRYLNTRGGTPARPGVSGTGSGASDPLHFDGWNLSNAWHYQSCESGGGLSTAWGCHWRLKAKPGYGAAAIYDVEGSEPGTWSAGSNSLTDGDRFRVRVVVGTPNYNTAATSFDVCLYLREGDSATQPHKAGRVCESRTWTGYHNWQVIYTDYYELPETADSAEYLRTYIWFEDQGSIYVGDWQVLRHPDDA